MAFTLVEAKRAWRPYEAVNRKTGETETRFALMGHKVVLEAASVGEASRVLVIRSLTRQVKTVDDYGDTVVLKSGGNYSVTWPNLESVGGLSESEFRRKHSPEFVSAVEVGMMLAEMEGQE